MKPSNFFKVITLIHLALIVGITVFSIIVLVSIENLTFILPSTNDIFLIVVPLVCVFGVVLGKFMYSKLTSSLISEKPIEQKVQIITSAIIVRYALAEGPALLSIVIVLVHENSFYFLFTAVMLIVFAGLKPNREKLGKELQLSSSQKEEMGM